jgi:hypothetical protein
MFEHELHCGCPAWLLIIFHFICVLLVLLGMYIKPDSRYCLSVEMIKIEMQTHDGTCALSYY